MADFEVLIEEVLDVYDHPNADRLSIVKVRDYNCISAKVGEDNHPRYKKGDRVIYIPEGAIVPEWLLKKGFWNEKDNKGFLAGAKGDRVKAVKLRGVVSQGILYSVDTYPEYDQETDFVFVEFLKNMFNSIKYNSVNETININVSKEQFESLNLDFTHPKGPILVGTDVADVLGITKYEPKLPDSFAGEVGYLGREKFVHYDIENIKKFAPMLEGKEVVLTEKLHGTLTCFAYWPGLSNDVSPDGFYVTSKGLAGKGIAYEDVPSNQETNTYIKMFNALDMKTKMLHFANDILPNNEPFFIFGEIHGEGIQDLGYSTPPTFRVFDIFIGTPLTGSFINASEKYDVIKALGLESVPVLWKGMFDKETILSYTSGTSSLDGKTIREGVVITPVTEFKDRMGRRAILKSISDEYLLRKGNTTEYN